MKPQVCILAWCGNPELIRATTLVFDTLRVGFPTADIDVYINGQCCGKTDAIEAACSKVDARPQHLLETSHAEWLETMARYKDRPFWICDTDLAFWDSMEQWDFQGQALGGRHVPKFFDEFTNCVTHARLHPSLMYIDPAEIKTRMDAFRAAFPQTRFNPLANLFYPMHVPPCDFYDSLCLLYRAIGGRVFEPKHLDCYDHLFCGTHSYIVGPHLNDGGMQKRHAAMMANPKLMRGTWRAQDEYFEAHAA